MSKWKEVGNWLKSNAGNGVGLVGSLLTGNVKGAIANGMSLVASATGTDDPDQALETLQNSPETLLKLKELQFRNEDDIRIHLREMKELELTDLQKEHSTTQDTIKSGDNAEDKFVRWTRPSLAWLSFLAAVLYVFFINPLDAAILGVLVGPVYTYMGLRQIGKGFDSVKVIKAINKGGG